MIALLQLFVLTSCVFDNKYEYYSDWSKTARREREMKAFQELKNDDSQRNNSINAPKL